MNEGNVGKNPWDERKEKGTKEQAEGRRKGKGAKEKEREYR